MHLLVDFGELAVVVLTGYAVGMALFLIGCWFLDCR